MKFNLKQISNLVDGRLITEMDDIYEMLSVYSGESLMTHQLPTAMKYLREDRPPWFVDAETILNRIKEQQLITTDDDSTETERKVAFNIYVKYIDNEFKNYMDKPCTDIMLEINQCDDTDAMMHYLVDNSLLYR